MGTHSVNPLLLLICTLCAAPVSGCDGMQVTTGDGRTVVLRVVVTEPPEDAMACVARKTDTGVEIRLEPAGEEAPVPVPGEVIVPCGENEAVFSGLISNRQYRLTATRLATDSAAGDGPRRVLQIQTTAAQIVRVNVSLAPAIEVLPGQVRDTALPESAS